MTDNKLKEALEVMDANGDDWHEKADAFYEKHNEHASAVIEQAARKYEKLKPLLREIAEPYMRHKAEEKRYVAAEEEAQKTHKISPATTMPLDWLNCMAGVKKNAEQIAAIMAEGGGE